jgi:hypothetical protein
MLMKVTFDLKGRSTLRASRRPFGAPQHGENCKWHKLQ